SGLRAILAGARPRLLSPMRVGLGHGLAQRLVHALEAGRGLASGLVAELAALDACPAMGALRSRFLPLAHPAPASFCRSSRAVRAASDRMSSPTSLPSDVVTGALSRSCSIMYSAISSTATNGRKVLGPGRIAASI